MNTFKLLKDLLAELKIHIPKNASRAVEASAHHIAMRIQNRSGVDIAVSDDGVMGKYNLILGNIGTPRSMNLCLPLEANRYGIYADETTDGWNVYLAGQEEVAVWRSAYYFYENCIMTDGSIFVEEKDVGIIEPLFVRDPYILKVGDTYYTYLNYKNQYWVAYKSTDLLHWTDFTVVMDPADQPPEFDAETDLWAPEVYCYRGKYYMVTTYKRKGTPKHENGHTYRGCCILCADEPMGRFKLITKGLVVPQNHMFVDGKWVEDGADSWSCIDATFYVDEEEKPWIVFSHEWVSCEHGGFFCAARLKEDLTDIEGEVHTLFNSYDGYLSDHEITDACYMYKTQDGQLLLLWSNDTHKPHCVGYCVRIARSKTGNILGPWTHDEGYLYDQTFDDMYQMFDGGHPCIVKDTNGQMLLCIHTPATHHETIHLVPIKEENGTLKIDEKP